MSPDDEVFMEVSTRTVAGPVQRRNASAARSKSLHCRHWRDDSARMQEWYGPAREIDDRIG